MKHSVEHLRFPETTVETVAEFCQLMRQVLGTDAMMDAPDIAFNIGIFSGISSHGGHLGVELATIFV